CAPLNRPKAASTTLLLPNMTLWISQGYKQSRGASLLSLTENWQMQKFRQREHFLCRFAL
ncbi:MAG: hypothetical protein IKM08_00775, partial [Clostridia bacterium]|nr:hypothetical protein [Clostridia bacterium]